TSVPMPRMRWRTRFFITGGIFRERQHLCARLLTRRLSFHKTGCPVRIFTAPRSAFNRPAAFKRSAASIRLEFFKLLVVFEAGIVIFPPGPGEAASSMESSCPLSLTFITAPVAFPLLVLVVDRVGELTFVVVVTRVLDRVGELTFVLVVPLVVATITGGSSNAGALVTG